MVDAARITVRRALASDLPAIVRIYNQAVDEQATADLVRVDVDERRRWLAAHPDDSYPALVAEIDGEVVGFASLGPHRPGRGAVRHTAEISYYVDQARRRSGVASRLIEACMERCPSVGIEILFAIVLDDNQPSIALLAKLGFERWGYLPGVARFGRREIGHLYLGRRVTPGPC